MNPRCKAVFWGECSKFLQNSVIKNVQTSSNSSTKKTMKDNNRPVKNSSSLKLMAQQFRVICVPRAFWHFQQIKRWRHSVNRKSVHEEETPVVASPTYSDVTETVIYSLDPAEALHRKPRKVLNSLIFSEIFKIIGSARPGQAPRNQINARVSRISINFNTSFRMKSGRLISSWTWRITLLLKIKFS